MSIIRIYNGLKESSNRMINLAYVSTASLHKNKITLYKSSQHESIVGSFLLFGGSGTSIEDILFEKEEDAKVEFDSICDTLKKYYDK